MSTRANFVEKKFAHVDFLYRDDTLLRIVATRSIVEVSTLFVRFALVFRYFNLSVRRREEKIRNEKRVKFA